jgi:hypothetical protein
MLRAPARTLGLAAALTMAAAAVPRPAQADDARETRLPWRLVWSQTDAAATCAGAVMTRRTVAERLGYDPFWESAASLVEVAVDREPGGTYTATLRFRDARGAETTKVLDSASRDCSVLGAATAFAIAVAIEESAQREPQEPAREPVEPPPPPARPARPPLPAAPRPTPTTDEPTPSVALLASGAGAVGLLPRTAAGVDLRGRVGLGRGFALSLGLAHYPEVRLDDNFDIGATHGRAGLCVLAVQRGGTALHACAHAHLVSTLVIVRALQPIDPGARLSGGASVGPTLARRVGPLLLVVGAELFVPVPRLAFQLVGSERIVYTAPAAAFLFSLGVGVGRM